MSWRLDVVLLGFVFGILLGFQLGRAPLTNPDEGRYAEVPREMLDSGDWVTPRLNGVNYFEKPVLGYWSVAACAKIFGRSEWSLRLTPAACALAGILLTYAVGRRFFGRDAGVASAAIVGTSVLFFGSGRFLVLDMQVSVLMAATLVCFLCGVHEPAGRKRRLLFYGLYASAALATLTKGFMGFLVTGAVMFLWLLLCGQWKRLRPLYLPTGVLLFLAIALPWHLLAAARNPTWAHRYIIFEHWERFTTTQHGRVEPWHYFLWVLIVGFFPWSVWLWRGFRDAMRGGWSRRRENAVAWFFVIWAEFIILFFSASQSKLPAYILPVFPAVAVMMGAAIDRTVREGSSRMRGELFAFSAITALVAVGVLVAVFKPGVFRYDGQAAAVRPSGIALAVVLLAGAAAVPLVAVRRGLRAGLAMVGGTAALFLLVLWSAVPDVQRPGTKAFALRVKAEAGPTDRVVHFGEFFHDFTFYAERLVDVVDANTELELSEDAAARESGRFYDRARLMQHWGGPERIWLITRKRDLAKLTADPAFRYQLLGESRYHYFLSNRP